jgi:holo-[acyl-carrier protein] synthase
MSRLSVGIDLVRVSRVAESLDRFGERFLRRLFTDAEIAYAKAAPALTAERLAARFAAKEAAIKALDLADRGVGFRQIEVRRTPSGRCELLLHGDASAFAEAAGVDELSVSLSHEDDFATAIVVTHAAKPLVTMGPQAAPNPGALRAPVTMGPQAAPNPGALRAPVTMGPQAAPNPGALRGPRTISEP